MVDRINEVMARAVADTFEGMVFMETLAVTQDCPASASTNHWTWLDVLDPFQARVFLELPEDLLRQVVAELYGLEGEDCTPDVLGDTLAELLNTLAGRVMALAVPEDTTFQLGLPTRGTGKPPLSGPGNTHLFTSSGHCIRVHVHEPEA